MAASPDSPSNDLVFKSFPSYAYDSDHGDRWSKDPHARRARTSVEAAIRAGLRHPSGGFSHAESSTTAPNPGLVVEGVGAIRLPLAIAGDGDVHAKSLIAVCQQAPFGQGERTVVDKEVRDTWQADAAQVQFTNPAWEGYIEQAVKRICLTLGVETETVTPKCEFYKLLVYEEGSHFLPHVDSEKTDGMFATMVVVLPSYFEGGAVHLTFNNENKIVDFGGTASAFQTSVLAWYTDVTHEVKPITAGYRLALAYNLFRPSESPTADLASAPVTITPVNDPSLAGLRQALTLWVDAVKQGQDTKAPQALAWLLEHKYSRACMRSSTLKGRDVHLVRRTQLVAVELGVCLGLAILTLTLQKQYQGYEYVFEYSDCNRSCWVKFLVDLEGKVVSDRLSFTKDLEGEMMPAEWKSRLEKVNCDKLEEEKWYGNEGAGEKKWYRRTVLVLWPQGQVPFKEARSRSSSE